MLHRFASFEDAQVLGELNHHLIQDEGHRNPMTVQELINRMRLWLETDYRASIFEDGSGIVAYALYREGEDHLYLRQFFVQRHKRGVGIGQQCVKILFSQVWPKDKRITVEVLCQNEVGIGFWRAVGFTDYSLTLEIYPDLRTTNAKAGDPASDSGCETTPSNSR
jgi:ribosomal protein S18 acetylase RimI-like enzyme